MDNKYIFIHADIYAYFRSCPLFAGGDDGLFMGLCTAGALPPLLSSGMLVGYCLLIFSFNETNKNIIIFFLRKNI
jgi:hypothetical protein